MAVIITVNFFAKIKTGNSLIAILVVFAALSDPQQILTIACRIAHGADFTAWIRGGLCSFRPAVCLLCVTSVILLCMKSIRKPDNEGAYES